MKVPTAITEGVKISVRTQFRPDCSRANPPLFLFHYQVEIENRNNFPIQLMSRYWHIFDLLNLPRIVEGEGVIGEQPCLVPGERFQYTSSCDLASEIGYMEGFYKFINAETREPFNVVIPRFQLFFPGKNN